MKKIFIKNEKNKDNSKRKAVKDLKADSAVMEKVFKKASPPNPQPNAPTTVAPENNDNSVSVSKSCDMPEVGR